jgi:hypothetical protein
MILVDIYVPSVNRTYDFQLNEQIPISTLVDEISEMIGQKEHSKIVGQTEKLLLCVFESSRILNPKYSLEELGVRTGEKLLLV